MYINWPNQMIIVLGYYIDILHYTDDKCSITEQWRYLCVNPLCVFNNKPACPH